MTTSGTGRIFFILCWVILLVTAIAAQVLFAGKAKKKAGVENNIFVIAAFAVALGWFFVRDSIGTYSGSVIGEAIGAVIMVVGVAGYLWALFVLRRNWSISAEIKEGHTLVTNGPYRFVRHPMYYFMMLVLIGSGLLISNYMILIFSPIVGIAYYFRAKVEERMLKEEFAGYGEYAKRTKMLIPGIF
ncbi:MAG: isoprenylcysteine carboxylmethyltransferase family protein [Candidatus Omnitrophota bacterium]